MEPAADGVGAVGRLARGGAANAAAAAIATGAGLLIIVLAGRSMSPAEYATFAAVWGLIFGSASVVSALEPEIARQHSLAAGPVNRDQVAATAVVGGGAALVVFLLLVAFASELRVDSIVVGVLAVVSVGLFATMFTARGFVAGSLRFVALAWMTFSEAAIRLLVILVALLAAVPAVPAFAGAALASACVGLPILITRSSRTVGAFGLTATLRRSGILMGGNAMAALLVTGAPVLVGLAMATAPAADVGQMQSAVVVSRFPLIALMLLQSLLVPVFARRASLYRRRDYRTIVGFLVLCLPTASLVAYALGPWFLQLLYGSAYVIRPEQMALLALGATALGGIQVLIALAVSADRHRLSLLAFSPAVVVTGCVAFLGALPMEMRVPVAMAIGPLVGFSVAVGTTARWRSGKSGSPAQLK